MINLQTLVLNADYRPLSYHPLSLWSWKNAVTALMESVQPQMLAFFAERRDPAQ